jgi:hypothetical protein
MMAGDRQLDDKINTWLEAEAPGQLPDRVLSATFERTRKSAQQGGWRRFRWSLPVNGFGSAVTATAVVVIGVMAGSVYFNQPGLGGRPASVASASESPSAAPETTQPAAPTLSPTAELTPVPTLEPTAAPTVTAAPTLYAWTSHSANEDWPAPLRVEQPGSGLESVTSLGSGIWQYADAQGDTTPGNVSQVDITDIHGFLGCVGGETPQLRCLEFGLSGQFSGPIPQPQDAWYGYGIVLDVDSDGVADYRYGVDNFDPGLGPFPHDPGRLWRADLHTGQVEVVAVPQASDSTLAGWFPALDSPGDAGFHFKNLSGRFYVWASLIQDGQVVATDYAPDTGWLKLVNK